jgi:hypothetical protein
MMSLLTELCPFVSGDAINMSALTGLKKSVFIGVHLWLKIQTPIAPFVHSKLPLAGACARPPTETLLGSAPVPVAVFGVAPKTVS